MKITPAAIEAINKGFSRRFQDALTSAQPWWSRIATEIPSSAKEEVHGFLDRIPRMREWVGERVVQNVAAREYSLKNKTLELTLEVDRDDIADDRLGIYNPTLDGMGAQAAKYPDDLLVTLLLEGKSRKGYDGQYFFDTDHPIDMDDPAAGVQANLFTGKALSEENYAAVRASMQSQKGADGRALGVRPNLLVVPPQLEFTARKIVNADINAAGATNVLKGTAEVFVIEELADEPGVWYLFDTTKPIKPFIFQNREAPEFTYLTDPTSENVFKRRKFLYGVSARGNAGFALHFLAARVEA